MKKKVYIGAAIVIVAIAMIALMVFVFSGKPAETSLELSGVWKVVKNVNEGSISIPQNEYMIFNDGEASDYRDGNPAPFAKSSYKSLAILWSFQTYQEPIISRNRRNSTFRCILPMIHISPSLRQTVKRL